MRARCCAFPPSLAKRGAGGIDAGWSERMIAFGGDSLVQDPGADMTEIPKSFDHLLAAWNERDLKKIRKHLDVALTKDVGLVDPNYAIEGVADFAKMVKEFRTRFPQSRRLRTSGVDMRHDRARYSWTVVVDEKTRIDGFDAVQLSKKSGKLKRIDRFFGPLPPAR